MQYLSYLDDLAKGHKTYALSANPLRVYLMAYRYDTTTKTGPDRLQNRIVNAYMRGYFLRKGFAAAIWRADPNVLRPFFKDAQDNPVLPSSARQAKQLIQENKLNVSGFMFVPTASEEQKERELGKLIDTFVETSKNIDFNSEKNGFGISFINDFGHQQVLYNNEGTGVISSDDIRGCLDLTEESIQQRAALRLQRHNRHLSKPSR